MFLFTILALIAIILFVVAIAFLSLGGALFIGVFSDLIICVVLIVLTIKFLFFRKRK